MVYASIYMKFKLGRIVLQFQREDKDHGLGDDSGRTDLERKENVLLSLEDENVLHFVV